MLRIRLAIEEQRANDVAAALEGTGGVHQIVSMSREPMGAGVVLEADLLPAVADQVMGLLRDWEIGEGSYLITRQEVIAPTPIHGPVTGGNEFAWIEVMGEARANARPLGRYLALMGVAALLGAIGVITDNPILVVGAMAVSPDLLPICAACVGLVAGRVRLHPDGGLPGPRGEPARPGQHRLLHGDRRAGRGSRGDPLLRDEGGVGRGRGDLGDHDPRLRTVRGLPRSRRGGVSWGAAGVLAVNVILLLFSGSATLALQTAFTRRRVALRDSAQETT